MCFTIMTSFIILAMKSRLLIHCLWLNPFYIVISVSYFQLLLCCVGEFGNSDIKILQVHVWGGISVRGATSVCVFSGVMESVGYQTILERNLLPFIKKAFPDGHRFWQDNDPKHTSNATKQWMKDNGINHWPTPPESPVSKH